MSDGLGGHPCFMHPMNVVRALSEGTADAECQRKAGKVIEELWTGYEERKAEIESLTDQLVAIKAAIGGNIVPLVAQLDELRKQ